MCCSPAGTGKTHTAGAIASQVVHGAVVCLAPTWKAIAVLRGKLGFLANVSYLTVQSFVLMPTSPPAALVMVDETSMLTMSHVRHVLKAYSASDARILFLGDDVQLPCIGRGFPIRDLAALLGDVRLTRCMRTDGAGLVAAAEAVRSGGEIVETDEVQIFPMRNPMQWVKEARAASFFHDPVTSSARPPWEEGYVQMISPQNRHVDQLNEAVQARQVAEEREAFSGCYSGDPVRLVENTSEYKNGDEGVLVSVEEEEEKKSGKAKGKRKEAARRQGVVRLRSGRLVRVSDKHAVPAYATTVHKVQGSEYDVVALLLFPGTHPNLKTREMVYTSVTRAKRRLIIAGDTSILGDCPPLVRRTLMEFV